MPFANNKGVKIHYEVEGKGPPIIFLHGTIGTLDTWHTNGLAAGLSKDYSCILLSARGRGLSDKPHDDKAYHFKPLIMDLVAVLDNMGIDKAHYLGYSMGGTTGFRIPMYAPDRFHSLILGGAGYVPGNVAKLYLDVAAGFDALERAVAEGDKDPWAAYFANSANKSAPITPERRAAVATQDARAIAAHRQAWREEPSPDAATYLPQFKLPCLIYVGEADPRCEHARKSAAMIPCAEFVPLPGLNHGESGQRSDVVLPHITRFLEKVERMIH